VKVPLESLTYRLKEENLVQWDVVRSTGEEDEEMSRIAPAVKKSERNANTGPIEC
jgi:hypothetical protein